MILLININAVTDPESLISISSFLLFVYIVVDIFVHLPRDFEYWFSNQVGSSHIIVCWKRIFYNRERNILICIDLHANLSSYF